MSARKNEIVEAMARAVINGRRAFIGVGPMLPDWPVAEIELAAIRAALAALPAGVVVVDGVPGISKGIRPHDDGWNDYRALLLARVVEVGE